MKQVAEEGRQGRSKWQRRECKGEASGREGNARLKQVAYERWQG